MESLFTGKQLESLEDLFGKKKLMSKRGLERILNLTEDGWFR